MFDGTTGRRQFLRWTVVSTGVGVAGCSGNGGTTDEGPETETPERATAGGIPSVSFDIAYSDGSVTISHESGDSVPAGRIRLRSSDGTTALWSDVTSQSPTEDVTAGDRAVVSGSTTGWEGDVGPGETIVVEYVDGETTATLAEGSVPSQTSSVDGLEVWAWDRHGSALGDTTDTYEQETGTTVSVVRRSERRLTDRFESALASGTGAPGCSLMAETDAGTWIETGGLRDLTGRLQITSLRDRFVDGVWEAISDGDRTYALPMSISPVGLYYRYDILEGNGIDLTTVATWNDMLDRLRDLPSRRYFLNVPSNRPARLWRALFRQVGGQPVDEDGAIQINSGKSRQVVELLRELVREGYADISPAMTPEWYDRVRNGDIVAVLAGNWIEGLLRDNVGQTAGDWRMIRPPAVGEATRRATAMGATSLVIPAQVARETADRAWNYIRSILADSGTMAEMYRQHNVFPANKRAYDTNAFGERKDFFGGQPTGRRLARVAPEIPGYRVTEATPAVTAAINDHVLDAVRGDSTPQQALDRAARQVARETDRSLT